jgi:hypothetical protein
MASIESVSIAALIALLPVVGAVAGIVLNNALINRGQRDRANRDALREASGAYISAVDVFVDHGRELRAVLELGAVGAERRESAYLAHLEAWRQLRARLPVVRIAGPEQIAQAVNRLQDTVGAYADLLANWYGRAVEWATPTPDRRGNQRGVRVRARGAPPRSVP